jgi:hypothetical protein
VWDNKGKIIIIIIVIIIIIIIIIIWDGIRDYMIANMAEEVDDVDKNEENILYDLAVLAEWKLENEIFVCTYWHALCKHYIRSFSSLPDCVENRSF